MTVAIDGGATRGYRLTRWGVEFSRVVTPSDFLIARLLFLCVQVGVEILEDAAKGALTSSLLSLPLRVAPHLI
jgi:hypothetical protein